MERCAYILRVLVMEISIGLALAVGMGAGAYAYADEGGNQVSFRGGWAIGTSGRSNEIFTDVNGALNRHNDGRNGSYVGGALDLLLTKDAWGMMSKTGVLGEIGVEYRRLRSNTVLPAAPALLGSTNPNLVQLTMLTVDIAPKIKFWEGNRLRPWIIPIGLDFIVISPPSNNTQYLDVGVQFGAGAEYQIWKAFKVGLDGRFHLASGATQTTNNFGTLGGYVGISF